MCSRAVLETAAKCNGQFCVVGWRRRALGYVGEFTEPVSLQSGYDEKLCHNCDTKPVFTAKTDFIDKMSLLILRNLLKTQSGSKIPAYMAHPLFFRFRFSLRQIQPIQISRTAGEWGDSAHRSGGYGARDMDRADRMRRHVGVGARPHEL